MNEIAYRENASETTSGKSRKWIWICAVIVALTQSAVLFAMVEGRAQILRHGEEVFLKTVPVDPRDLLRGRYVTLRFDISEVEIPENASDDLGHFENDPVYISLEKEADFHVLKATSETKPDSGLFIAGKVTSRFSSANQLSVSYGIERFFLPEDVAPEIERLYRDRKTEFVVVVAVNEDGSPQIKRLEIDGEPAYEVPYY